MMESQQISTKTEARDNVFFSGVLILTLSTILVKIIGLLYKIPMLHCLGSVGMGYFNAAYECYALISVLATAGLPIASSMMIAEARSRNDSRAHLCIRRVERVSLRIFVLIGITGTLLLLLGASPIAKLIGSPQTAPALMAVAPTVLFSCLSAAYRGYFQGFQNMRPTAISQLIEAVGKLVFGVRFGMWAAAKGMSLPYVAAAAMIGLSLGVAISAGYLFSCRLHHTAKGAAVTSTTQASLHCAKRPGIVRPPVQRLIRLAIPITLSSSVLSLTKVVDMTLILRRLQHLGLEAEQAEALYGIYTTVTVPIFNLVPALLTSIALALIPTLSSDIEAGNRQAQRETVNAAMRITALLSIPAALALSLYSRPIIALLFRVSSEDLDVSSGLLTTLSLSVAFAGLITTTNAILQAYGRTKLPIYSMLIGAATKLLCAAVLIGIPSINIYGAPLSTLICNSVIVGINLAMIAKHTGILDPLRKILLLPLALSVPAVGLPALLFSVLSRSGMNERLAFVIVLPLTLFFLLLLALKGGVLQQKELESIANGRLNRLLDRRLRFLLPKKL